MSTGSNAIDSCWKVVGALRELEQDWNDRHAKARFFEQEKHPLSKHELSLLEQILTRQTLMLLS